MCTAIPSYLAILFVLPTKCSSWETCCLFADICGKNRTIEKVPLKYLTYWHDLSKSGTVLAQSLKPRYTSSTNDMGKQPNHYSLPISKTTVTSSLMRKCFILNFEYKGFQWPLWSGCFKMSEQDTSAFLFISSCRTMSTKTEG